MNKMEKSDILRFVDLSKKFIETQKDPPYVVASQIPRISNSPVDWLEVKESKYGKGVFATKPLKKGDYATFYPCHQIAIRKDSKEWDVISQEGHPVLYKDYSVSLTPSLRICGIPDYVNTLFCGHLFNDPCPDIKIKYLKKWMTRYEKLSPNIEFDIIDDVWVAMKTVRDIEPGEELTVCYGFAYWIARSPYKKLWEKFEMSCNSKDAV